MEDPDQTPGVRMNLPMNVPRYVVSMGFPAKHDSFAEHTFTERNYAVGYLVTLGNSTE